MNKARTHNSFDIILFSTVILFNLLQAKTTMETTSSKKKVVKTASADHPKYSEMIKQALMALKERGGSSRQAVLKYIMANFNVGRDEASVNTHLKMALRAGVKNSSLKQSKGTGATGSFRLGEAEKKPKAQKPKGQKKEKKVAKTAGAKKQPKKASTPGATKPASGAPVAAAAAKPQAKKSPVKAKKSGGRSTPKSPKKVVKKAAAGGAKKQASAKPKATTKAVKPVAKKVAAPAAKKAVKGKQ